MNDLIDPAGAAALLDTAKVGFAAMLGGLPGATRHGGDGLWWVDTGVPDGEFNGAYTAPDSGDDHEYAAAVAEVVTYFRGRGRPFHWSTGLRPEPVDAGAILRANGLRHVEDEPGMWLDLAAGDVTSAPGPAGLEIRPVADPEALRDWMRVWGGGAPPEVEARWYDVYRRLPYGPDGDLRMFVGYTEGRAVATCYIHRTGAVALVRYVVTAASYRRRGFGAAMTVAALRAARTAGCDFAVLTASPDGIGIYRRLGFRECCLVGTYEWAARNSSQVR